MTLTAPRTRAARWLLTIVLALMSLLLAGFFGIIALVTGSHFMAAETEKPVLSLILWTLAGAVLATPVAALPTLGFSVRRRAVWPVAAALAAAVVLVGVFALNQP